MAIIDCNNVMMMVLCSYDLEKMITSFTVDFESHLPP